MFARVAIAGFGLVGGSIALAVRERYPSTRLVAIDRQPVVDLALRLRAADSGGDALALASDADLIVLAAPVRQNIAILRDLPRHVATTALVTDVGSTKQATVEAAAALPPRLRFVGGHPLAGAAAGGIEMARRDLFRARPWILTPGPAAAPADVSAISDFVASFGAAPKTMEARAHDRLMAYLSHLPQLTVSALMQVVGEHAGSEGLAFAGNGLRDTTRLASSPAGTWRDVAATNADAVGEAIDDLIVALQRLKTDLAAGDELQRVFDAAAQWKRTLEDPEPGSHAE
jgi:prephenate dehydrogenase